MCNNPNTIGWGEKEKKMSPYYFKEITIKEGNIIHVTIGDLNQPEWEQMVEFSAGKVHMLADAGKLVSISK